MRQRFDDRLDQATWASAALIQQHEAVLRQPKLLLEREVGPRWLQCEARHIPDQRQLSLPTDLLGYGLGDMLRHGDAGGSLQHNLVLKCFQLLPPILGIGLPTLFSPAPMHVLRGPFMKIDDEMCACLTREGRGDIAGVEIMAMDGERLKLARHLQCRIEQHPAFEAWRPPDILRAFPIGEYRGDALAPIDTDRRILAYGGIRADHRDMIASSGQRPRFALDARIDAQIRDHKHQHIPARREGANAGGGRIVCRMIQPVIRLGFLELTRLMLGQSRPAQRLCARGSLVMFALGPGAGVHAQLVFGPGDIIACRHSDHRMRRRPQRGSQAGEP